ncbi:MAG: hypothetical protein KDA69_15465 [Planctomycetaceae bacterium]|nr:hypothetical protein [Planctomycetaceae bacterium]MCA9045725.1 hypothetical protein [Planctomycetaceae bacterium]MCB9950989.1 hypothetical protein [Planctomycetaceae bacterium]
MATRRQKCAERLQVIVKNIQDRETSIAELSGNDDRERRKEIGRLLHLAYQEAGYVLMDYLPEVLQFDTGMDEELQNLAADTHWARESNAVHVYLLLSQHWLPTVSPEYGGRKRLYPGKQWDALLTPLQREWRATWKTVNELARLMNACRPKRQKAKPGRLRVSDAEAACRLDIIAEWNKAKEAKTGKKQFCKDKGISVKELDSLMRWKLRSDK